MYSVTFANIMQKEYLSGEKKSPRGVEQEPNMKISILLH